MKKIRTIHKISLILFGIVFFFVLLELGLRIGGFVLTTMKEHRNKIALSKQSDFHILCLGESTTDGQWPPYLDEILNREITGARFTVIDKGRTATDTALIVSHLEDYLNVYNPDVVITMMGINDAAETLPYDDSRREKIILFFQSFRTLKLMKLLWQHIAYKLSNETDVAQEINTYLTQPPDTVGKSYDKNVEEQYVDDLGVQQDKYPDDEKRKHVQAKINAYQKAIRANPNDYDAYFNLGKYYHKNNMHEEAETILKEIITLRPDHFGACVELGEIYKKENRHKEAEKMFRAEVKRTPDQFGPYLMLGICYKDQKKYDQAISVLGEANKLDPDNIQIYYELALCYWWSDENYNAMEEIFSIVEGQYENETLAKNDFYFIYSGVGRDYLHYGKYKQAEVMLRKALAINAHEAQGYVLLGWSLKEQGRFAEAEEMYQQAIEVAPREVSNYIELAAYYIYRQRYTDARTVLRRAQQLDAAESSLYFTFGICYFLENKFNEANKNFAKAFELAEMSVHYPYNLARKFIIEGKDEIIEEMALRAAELYAEQPHFDFPFSDCYTLLYECYTLQKEYAKAEDLYKRAIAENPEDGRLYAGLALNYLNQGEVVLANTYFKKAKELRLKYYFPSTHYNYNRLKDMVEARQIQLVCVQYPIRSVAPLKRLLEPHKGALFVNNEKIFKKAVRNEGYKEYFRDNFGGDFGHCTEKGNRLLAQNIAAVIIEEYLNRKDIY